MANAMVTPEMFDGLKPGTLVSITWRSCMSTRTEPLVLRVGRRTHSKGGVSTLHLNRPDGRKVAEMSRIRLYKRSGGEPDGTITVGVYPALGDMAVSFTSFEIVG
jgi:hypothetical protein